MGFLSELWNALKIGSSFDTRSERADELLRRAQAAADRDDIREAERLAEQWERETGRRR